jgi:hypothetical protein
MSTTRTFPADESDSIERRVNDENGTVTFVSSHDAENTAGPTEWITVTADAVVDLSANR